MTQSLIERIQNHSQPDLRRRIEVAEWALPGQSALVITYTMVTLNDLSLAHEAAQSQDFAKVAPYLVAMKACDEDGAKHFKMGDAITLREVAAPDIVNRIALQMLGRVTVPGPQGEVA